MGKPAAPKEEEKPKEATPSWKTKMAEKKEPSLGKISESPSSSNSTSTPSWKKKVAEEPPKQDTPAPTSKPQPSWKRTTTTTTAATNNTTTSNTTSTSAPTTTTTNNNISKPVVD